MINNHILKLGFWINNINNYINNNNNNSNNSDNNKKDNNNVTEQNFVKFLKLGFWDQHNNKNNKNNSNKNDNTNSNNHHNHNHNINNKITFLGCDSIEINQVFYFVKLQVLELTSRRIFIFTQIVAKVSYYIG